MKTCYYELLGVEAHASDIELKKAYRRKALQYHPDKNIGNVEEATEIFATIRSAYEVLSDPQERAWYDSHKEQILSDAPIGSDDGFNEEYEVDSMVTGVTTDELLMFFNSSLYTRFDNSPAGIFQIAGRVFGKLAMDEVFCGRKLGMTNYSNYKDDQFEQDINSRGYILAFDARGSNIDDMGYLYPAFGYSSTDYEYLKYFYKKWASFTTLKSFSWKDEYVYSRNYDRRTKREINKRNEKARQQARNEYNKTVKRFVNFIKKLDKRITEGAKKTEELRKAREEKRKEQQKADQASKRKGELLNNDFELQSWQVSNDPNWEELERQYENSQKKKNDQTDEHMEGILLKDSNEILVYECVICDKVFKSEKQLENHAKTRLHKKNVHEIQREMERENMTLGLEELSDLDEFTSAAESEGIDTDHNAKEVNKDTEVEEITLDQINAELAEIERQLAEADIIDSGDDESDMENIIAEEINHNIDSPKSISDGEVEVESEEDTDTDHLSEEEQRADELNRLLEELQNPSLGGSTNSDSDEDWTTGNKKKSKGKSKGKNRQTKGNKSSSTTPIPTLKLADPMDSFGTEICGTCGQSFDSRNKLFSHVQAKGHAAPTGKSNPGLKKKKKRRNKI